MFETGPETSLPGLTAKLANADLGLHDSGFRHVSKEGYHLRHRSLKRVRDFFFHDVLRAPSDWDLQVGS